MQEKYEVKLSNKAKSDLKSIVMYIKNDLQEPCIAKKYVKLLKKEINSLEYYPQKYAIIDDEKVRDLKVRKLVVNNYIAFYRINESKNIVNIDRILYGASNWIDKL